MAVAKLDGLVHARPEVPFAFEVGEDIAVTLTLGAETG